MKCEVGSGECAPHRAHHPWHTGAAGGGRADPQPARHHKDSGAAAKPRRQRPPQQARPAAAPEGEGWDVAARVRALLAAVEARVQAKVRRGQQ